MGPELNTPPAPLKRFFMLAILRQSRTSIATFLDWSPSLQLPAGTYFIAAETKCC